MYRSRLITIKEASEWATQHLHKQVSASNISYLIQYGRIAKIEKDNECLINLNELTKYYEETHKTKKVIWQIKKILRDLKN